MLSMLYAIAGPSVSVRPS